jgi:hypothetical protein
MRCARSKCPTLSALNRVKRTKSRTVQRNRSQARQLIWLRLKDHDLQDAIDDDLSARRALMPTARIINLTAPSLKPTTR